MGCLLSVELDEPDPEYEYPVFSRCMSDDELPIIFLHERSPPMPVEVTPTVEEIQKIFIDEFSKQIKY